MDSSSLWQTVLGEIEVSISSGNFNTWFKGTELVEVRESDLVISVNNLFKKYQLEGKYLDLITDIVKKNGIDKPNIIFKIAGNKSTSTQSEENIVLPERMVASESTPASPLNYVSDSNGLSHSYRQNLIEKYTIDNFVVGSGNELAFAACQSIIQKPGKKYNPLFLYGGVGIGKTHLMQAVGNALKKQNPDFNILYISTEQFVQEFVDSLRKRKTQEFAHYYRSADVLIVDDIQFIAGKEKIQEEFFHTFNALHQAEKQIILSSDKPPKEIPSIEERLKSRFEWGMSIDMQYPDYETRCAIIKSKSDSLNISLKSEVIEYIANITTSNVRELEGLLNQLLAFCDMRAIEPTLSVAESIIGISKNRPKHLSSKMVIEKVSKHYQISLDDLIGPKRDKDIVVPRQVAMYLLREELKLSYPKIARELGRKDHTTALHSVDKIHNEIEINPDIKKAINDIKEKLYA
ncbi:MAG: chromosomal replication initiator protein DnaA [Chitinophagia bacterium]|nr:chromosomal replication initiator protein DnaA [Chitinophagia bacterium]